MLADPELSEGAVASLAMLGDVAVGPLIAKLRSRDEATVSAAADLLGRAGSETAVGSLIGLLEEGEAGLDAVARSLGTIGSEEAVSAILGLLGSESAELRNAGINGLSQLSRPTAAADLVKLIDSPHPTVRLGLVEAFGRLGIEQGREAVVRGCIDEDHRVRAAAVRALLPVAGESGANLAMRSLKDESPAVRAAAALALSEYGGEGACDALAAALADSDPWTRYFALRGLGRLKASNCSDLIRQVAQGDPAEHVRIAAGEVLSELGV